MQIWGRRVFDLKNKHMINNRGIKSQFIFNFLDYYCLDRNDLVGILYTLD